jgi:FKBP-type peptidyl-prolyl cis-trans isomerase
VASNQLGLGEEKQLIMEDYNVGFNWKNIFFMIGVLAVAVILVIGINQLIPLKENEVGSMQVVEENKNKTEELKIEDIKVGQGREVKEGDTISVHYKGTLTNGKQFGSSYDNGKPFVFKVGAGEVIAGWDKGVIGMKAGGKRRLTVPPELGYGQQGVGEDIPPNSTLIFEIELLEVK